jgi:uncharacterized protein (TIRG00374 family)
LWARIVGRLNLRTVVVSLLALALVVWFLRGANAGDIVFHLRRARWDLLLVSFACLAFGFVGRAIRWQYLLLPVGKVSFGAVFRTTVIGFGALGLLPVRAGDVIRPYLLARREGLSATATFATVIMERVLDLVTILVLMAAYVWGFAGEGTIPEQFLGAIKSSSAVLGAGGVGVLVMMWVLATHPERVGTLAGVAGRVLPGRLSQRVEGMARTFSTGFAAIRDARALAMAVLWSFPIWIAIAAQAWAVTIAFGIAMPFVGALLLQALLVIGVAVPTPGGVGSFHEAYRIGVTTFFGASNAQAIAAAIVTHAIAYVPVVIVGVVFMAQDGLSVGGLRGIVVRPEPEPAQPVQE